MGKRHSQTTDQALRAYAIGEKVRRLRLRKKIGLVELGAHTGLSPALLSKIENGKIHPPLPTLVRIALVFGVGLEHFFGDGAKEPALALVRRGERQRFPSLAGASPAPYHFESLDYPATEKPFSGFLAEFEPVDPGKASAHAHEGFELIYLIRGTLGMRIGEKTVELRKGDSLYFDASVPHAYWRIGGGACEALVVTNAP